MAKPKHYLSREEKDAVEEKLWRDGGTGIITTINGVPHRISQTTGELEPITGTEAQQAVKKKKKPRKPKAGG